MYVFVHCTKNFIDKYICTRKFTKRDVDAEQKKMMLSGKNYIHAKGLWNEYVAFIKKEIDKFETVNES